MISPNRNQFLKVIIVFNRHKAEMEKVNLKNFY